MARQKSSRRTPACRCERHNYIKCEEAVQVSSSSYLQQCPDIKALTVFRPPLHPIQQLLLERRESLVDNAGGAGLSRGWSWGPEVNGLSPPPPPTLSFPHTHQVLIGAVRLDPVSVGARDLVRRRQLAAKEAIQPRTGGHSRQAGINALQGGGGGEDGQRQTQLHSHLAPPQSPFRPLQSRP